MVIPTGSVKVIVAFGSTMPASGGDISYHGVSNRASVAMVILNSLNSPLVISAADNAVNYNFTFNV